MPGMRATERFQGFSLFLSLSRAHTNTDFPGSVSFRVPTPQVVWGHIPHPPGPGLLRMPYVTYWLSLTDCERERVSLSFSLFLTHTHTHTHTLSLFLSPSLFLSLTDRERAGRGVAVVGHGEERGAPDREGLVQGSDSGFGVEGSRSRVYA